MSSTPSSGAPAPGEDLAFTDRWRRSLERSRSRRLAAAIQRRRRFRSRGAILSLAAVLTVSAAGAGIASGQVATSQTLLTEGSGGSQVAAVQEALGLPADGYYDRGTARAVRDFQSQNGLLVDGIVGPQTAAALGIGSPAAAPAESAGEGAAPTDGTSTGNATLEQIAQCESGGNPSAVSSDGQYRGKYQFSQETWQAIGGTGDPAAAPEAEQDRLAAQLLAQSGTSPWPSCS